MLGYKTLAVGQIDMAQVIIINIFKQFSVDFDLGCYCLLFVIACLLFKYLFVLW